MTMHIYFSGIGGTGLGPLALIAKDAGYDVSGSDKQDSQYIHYLNQQGIANIALDQSYETIAKQHQTKPIDWFVYSTALTAEHEDPEEIQFCHDHGIRVSRRDELLNEILATKNLQLLAIAGTHGKTTTTAMAIWLLQQIGVTASYSVGAKIPFGEMGRYIPDSKYFVYEADEYARNFLAFHPHIALITGVDWDHADIYPTREEYEQAFRDFLQQSKQAILWQSDAKKLHANEHDAVEILDDTNTIMLNKFIMPGIVNRRNAWQVVRMVHELTGLAESELIDHMNRFPGLSRRFEKLRQNLYTDYAHTPPKIRGAIQTAQELAGENVVVVYEGLHNTRQHFIKDELKNLFDDVKKLYIVPSYLAREDTSLALLHPQDLHNLLSIDTQAKAIPSECNETLREHIARHLENGDLVLCLSAGGGNSLDEWLRQHFPTEK